MTIVLAFVAGVVVGAVTVMWLIAAFLSIGRFKA